HPGGGPRGLGHGGPVIRGTGRRTGPWPPAGAPTGSGSTASAPVPAPACSTGCAPTSIGWTPPTSGGKARSSAPWLPRAPASDPTSDGVQHLSAVDQWVFRLQQVRLAVELLASGVGGMLAVRGMVGDLDRDGVLDPVPAVRRGQR